MNHDQLTIKIVHVQDNTPPIQLTKRYAIKFVWCALASSILFWILALSLVNRCWWGSSSLRKMSPSFEDLRKHQQANSAAALGTWRDHLRCWHVRGLPLQTGDFREGSIQFGESLDNASSGNCNKIMHSKSNIWQPHMHSAVVESNMCMHACMHTHKSENAAGWIIRCCTPKYRCACVPHTHGLLCFSHSFPKAFLLVLLLLLFLFLFLFLLTALPLSFCLRLVFMILLILLGILLLGLSFRLLFLLLAKVNCNWTQLTNVFQLQLLYWFAACMNLEHDRLSPASLDELWSAELEEDWDDTDTVEDDDFRFFFDFLSSLLLFVFLRSRDLARERLRLLSSAWNSVVTTSSCSVLSSSSVHTRYCMIPSGSSTYYIYTILRARSSCRHPTECSNLFTANAHACRWSQDTGQQGCGRICFCLTASSRFSFASMIIRAVSSELYFNAICSRVSHCRQPRWRNWVVEDILRYMALSFQMPLHPVHCSKRICNRSEPQIEDRSDETSIVISIMIHRSIFHHFPNWNKIN